MKKGNNRNHNNRNKFDPKKTAEEYGAELRAKTNAHKLNINYSVFRKTDEERNQLKEMRSLHKHSLLNAGLDPKKVMNLPGITFKS